ncbi:MAG: energy-coupling factor transporter transmembrane protein EcfT [Treponema sp.]|jgi:energy-coupling factor transport system permease protein|nr:energy-coupling factor transporter transmembrane protein EcfT [Treponema sp.]
MLFFRLNYYFKHKLHPGIKLIFTLIFSVLIFLVDKLSVAVWMLIFFIFIRLAANFPFRGKKYVKNLTLLAALIILMQTLFGPGEIFLMTPLFPPSFPILGGMGSLKWEGFILGLTIICRLSALALLFSIFSETTPPYKIALGLSSFGINYRISFIFSTAFNLVPLFRDEASAIIDAQKLRGLGYFETERKSPRKTGTFFDRINALSALTIPLVLGAMRKARQSSIAMDARGFGIYNARTWLDKPQFKKHDFFFALGCVILSACFLFANYRL